MEEISVRLFCSYRCVSTAYSNLHPSGGEAFTLWVLSLCFVGGAILVGILVTILYEFYPPFKALVQNSSGIDEIE